MTASIIDGKIISAEVRAEAKLEVERFVEQYKTKPCLAVVLVGENPASQVYVRTKSKMAKEIGMDVEDHIKQKDISEEHLIGIINELNIDKRVNGILVQLPLPEHIDSRVIIDAIDPKKDADGFHALNVGRNSIGGDLLKKSFVPCTPLGCFLMLKRSVPNLAGMHAVIIGRSNIVGKPMAQLLLEESCTVTIVHSKTKDLDLLFLNELWLQCMTPQVKVEPLAFQQYLIFQLLLRASQLSLVHFFLTLGSIPMGCKEQMTSSTDLHLLNFFQH